MGLLVDGVWQDDVSRTKDGHFIRPARTISQLDYAGRERRTLGRRGLPAESGRYHLYVSLACPWAHRTVIFRKLKALENVISLSVVSPNVGREGWTFTKSEGSTGDELNGKSKLSEVYLLANPRYSGRVSVPVLWDKSARRSSTTSRLRLSGCSIRRLMPLPMSVPITIRKICAPKSSASTPSSIRISITASIVPASPPRKQPMKSRFATSSIRSMSSNRSCRNTATLLETRSRKPTGGCFAL